MTGREVNTTDPSYYKWTQWIFEQLYKKGLAYESETLVNWAPDMMGGTVVSNEEVVDGKTERGGYDVYRVPMKQWSLKITAYADRLIDDLDDIDWPENIKEQQRNWIGRSVGASIRFRLLVNLTIPRLKCSQRGQTRCLAQVTWSWHLNTT